jgi:tetratricopeptide (TPR) repeat protein
VSEDWFRNSSWNEAIEKEFNEKLHRARRKHQYLRIQASTLARSRPEVSLKLLDRYFTLGDDDFDQAQAHVDRATALLTLGRFDDALAAYEAALKREVAFPNLQTNARIEFPYVVATARAQDHYARALELLDLCEPHLMFPVDHFRSHAARALIASSRGDIDGARAHANRAIDAKNCDKSGFPYHPSIGLVGQQYESVVAQLASIIRAL